MEDVDPVVIAALIAGLSGMIGSAISFLLFKNQANTTNKLERDMKEHQTKLELGSNVYLRLFEKAMEDMSETNSLLRDVHLKLCDYKNGILYSGSYDDIEKKNLHRYFEAWNLLRFPRVYVPGDITGKLETIRHQYETIRKSIYEIGQDPSRDNRMLKLAEYDKLLEDLEKMSTDLVHHWKERLRKEDISEVLHGSNY